MTASSQHIESEGDDKIEGLQLVYMTGARLDRSEDRDDTGYPYRLEVNLSPPQLMAVAFIMLHGGSEEIVVRSKTRDAIDRLSLLVTGAPASAKDRTMALAVAEQLMAGPPAGTDVRTFLQKDPPKR